MESIGRSFKDAMKETTETMMERMERSKYPEDEDGDRFAAVGWKGFERTTPFIEDNDPDMETHDMKFDQMIKLMSLTRHKPKAIGYSDHVWPRIEARLRWSQGVS